MAESSKFEVNKGRVLADYRIAIRSRRTDDAQTKAVRDGKAKFCIWGAGQEVAQLAEAEFLRPGDWMRGYYRDLASLLKLDLFSVRQIIAQVLGDTTDGNDPSSGGRMMAHHTGTRFYNAQNQPIDREGNVTDKVDYMSGVNRASDVSSIGSQFAVALGLAQASNVFKEVPGLADRQNLSNDGREITLVSGGDSSAAEGVFWEAMNQAAVHKVPLLASIRNNGYGITVPVEREIVHGSVASAMRGLEESFKIMNQVPTWDYPATMQTFKEAYAHVRSGGTPTLVETLVTQPYGHSSSGSNRHKSPARMKFEIDKDPITNMRAWILSESIATEAELNAIEKEEAGYVREEAASAWVDFYDPLKAVSAELKAAYSCLIAVVPGHDILLKNEISKLEKMEVATQGGYLSRGGMIDSMKGVLGSTRSERGKSAWQEIDALLRRTQADLTERYSSQVYASGDRSPLNRKLVAPTYNPDGLQDTGASIFAAWLAIMMDKDPRIVVFGQDDGALGGVMNDTLGLQGGFAQVVASVNLTDEMLVVSADKARLKLVNGPDTFVQSDTAGFGEMDYMDFKIKESIARYPALGLNPRPEGFGEARVWDEPIAENTSLGKAVGMALRGLRPIVAAQYFDYAIYMAQQMRDELASLRWRTDGGQTAPVIIRTRGHRLEGVWHAGSPVGTFLSIPGMRIVVPRNQIQSAMMMRALLESDDPALVVDPLMKFRAKFDVPTNLGEMELPLGQSEVLREGKDLTIVTYGYCCDLALAAAEKLQEEYGVSVEVVDLQTLNPLDLNGVAQASIEKTGKVLMLDEDTLNGAAGMVMSDLLVRKGLLYAVYAAAVLTAPDHMPAYANDGGYDGKPQIIDIVDEVLWTMDGVDGGEDIDGVRCPRLAYGNKGKQHIAAQEVLNSQIEAFRALKAK